MASIRGCPDTCGSRDDHSGGAVLGGLLATSLAIGLLAGIDPKLAIAAALGLGFACLVLANITVGLCFFAFISFLEVLSSSYGITKLVGFLLVLSWLAVVTTRDDAQNDFMSAHPTITYVLALFVGWSALSLLWAENIPRGDRLHLPLPAERVALPDRLHGGPQARARALGRGRIRDGRERRGGLRGPQPAPGRAVRRLPSDRARSATRTSSPRCWWPGVILAGVLVSLLQPLAGRCASWPRQPPCSAHADSSSTFSRGGLVALGCAMLAGMFVGGRWRGRAVAIGVSCRPQRDRVLRGGRDRRPRRSASPMDGGTRPDRHLDASAGGWCRPTRSAGSAPATSRQLRPLPAEAGRGQSTTTSSTTRRWPTTPTSRCWPSWGSSGSSCSSSILVFAVVCALKAARRFARGRRPRHGAARARRARSR